jgi:host cell factor
MQRQQQQAKGSPIKTINKTISVGGISSGTPVSLATAITSQPMRLVTGGGGSIRVLSAGGQQVRLAQGGAVTGATILRSGQTGTIISSTATTGTQNMSTSGAATTSTLGGKQVIIQKPFGSAGGQHQIVTLVKTSQGVTMQMPTKMNVLQKQQLQTGTGGSLQLTGQNIVAGTSATSGGNKTAAVLGGNVVKLMSSTGIQGNKIVIPKNPNFIQVGKMTTNVQGKPTFVITNKAGQQLRSNQPIIVVTTTPGIRTVQSGHVTSTANSNVMTLTSTGQSMNQATMGPGGTVKMIRSVQGGASKPISFVGLQTNKTGGAQIIHMPQKQLTIGGKSVTVQLAPGSAQGSKTVTLVSSAGGIQTTTLANAQQKIVVLPSMTTTGAGRSFVIKQQQKPMTLHQTQIVSASSSSGGVSSSDDAAAALAAALQDDVLISKNTVDDDGLAEYIKMDQMDGASDNLPVKSQPVFHKMGLFGGAPPTDDEDEYESGANDDGNESSSTINKIGDYTEANEKMAEKKNLLNADSIDFESAEEKCSAEEKPPKLDENKLEIKQEEELNISGPSASDQEAANILTTIKSGELLNSPNSDNQPSDEK